MLVVAKILRVTHELSESEIVSLGSTSTQELELFLVVAKILRVTHESNESEIQALKSSSHCL